MGKRIGILVEFNYEDLEIWYPMLRFREAGHETFSIGPEKGKTYTSKHGYPCKSDYGIDEISVQDIDALVLPGGFCPDYLRRNKAIVDLVREGVSSGKVVASICHGAWMFCSAKCIKGRTMTCFHAIRDDLENAGATYVDKAVVVDGNIVSSRIPSDLPDFCKAILAKLE